MSKGLEKVHYVMTLIEERRDLTPKGHNIEVYLKHFRIDYVDLDSILKKLSWEQKIIQLIALPVIGRFDEKKYTISILPGFDEFYLELEKKIQTTSKTENDKNELIDQLLKERDELREKLDQLEDSQWEGFDEHSPDYPNRLDIANMAYRAAFKNRDFGVSFTQFITAWLQKYYPSMSPTESEKILYICKTVSEQYPGRRH